MTYRKKFFVALCAVGLLGCNSVDETSSAAKVALNEHANADTGVSKASLIWPKLTSAIAQDQAMEARINELLARMTLEEKVGQMIQSDIRHVTAQDFTEYHLGSVLNGGGTTPNNNKYAPPKDWVALADSFWFASIDKSNGRVAIPMMWGSDAVHGDGNVFGATLFPHNIALGATRNPELIRQIGWATAREIAATGLDWNFSPTLAVSRDERWGRAYEAYSEDPELVAAYAGEMVKGLQGEAGTPQLFSDERVIATAKHWIGDGGTAKGVDRGETLGDEQELRKVHGAGYVTAIEAGVQMVMASFSSWHGERLHGSRYLLTDVLKQQMGFDGAVVGDWNAHGFVPGCVIDSCPQAINAGLDIFMVPDKKWKTLLRNTIQQTRDGVIPQARIDDAVRRILRVKMRAGLFTKGAPSTRSLAGRADVLGSANHRAIARQAVRESLVMLKNKKGLLPLNPKTKVLVAGDGANNMGKQTGGWSISWQGTGNENADFPGATTIWQGIEQAVTRAGGKAVLSEQGKFTVKPDVAIVVFGEDPYAEMQGDLSSTYYKPKDARDVTLLKSFHDQGIPVVALFITGRPLHINRELNASDAFVVVWQPGTEGGGIADVLFTHPSGAANVGGAAYDMRGRLSFTWPKEPSQVPINRGDSAYDPLFAYGFGLSYRDKDTLTDQLPETQAKRVETQDQLDIFVRRPLAPWNLEIVGNANDRMVVTTNTQAVSTLRIEAVDRNVQEDARRVVWSGKGEGLVAAFNSESQDFSDYLENKAALVFDVKVDQAPSQKAYLRWGCGVYCASELDVTQQLRDLAAKGWQTVSVDLRCFPISGAEFGLNIPVKEFVSLTHKPFAIWTKGLMDLSFSEVRIIKNRAKGATISCP